MYYLNTRSSLLLQFLLLAGLSLDVTALAAAEPTGPLPITSKLELRLDINAGGGPPPARITSIPVANQAFTQAQRLQVDSAGAKAWSVLLATVTTEPIAKGDTLVLAVWLRQAAEPATPTVQAYFQKAASPWSKSLHQAWQPTATWKEFRIAFRAKGTYAAREAALGLACGAEAMAIEIGPATLYNYRGIEPATIGSPIYTEETK